MEVEVEEGTTVMSFETVWSTDTVFVSTTVDDGTDVCTHY